MFNIFGALTATANSGLKGYTEELPKVYDMMGAAALGKAFQPQAGPIDQLNQQGPQAPPPGQSSQPMQQPPPMMQAPPMQQGGPPMPSSMPERNMQVPGGGPNVSIYSQNQFNPMDAAAGRPPMPVQGRPMLPQGQSMMGGGGQPMPQPAGGSAPPPQAPPGASPSPSPAPGGMPGMGGQGMGQQGMPQLDLQTLAQRIQQTSPGLPPQAMIAALTKAVPLLNVQGRQELAQLRMQMQQQGLDIRREGLDVRREAIEGRERAAQGKDAETKSSAGEIADAIKRGDQPPTLQGLYKQGAAVRSARAKDGFNLAKAQQEWSAAQKQIQSLNGPQMTRYAGLANSVVNTIDEVKSLSEEMQNSGIPLLNRAKLQAYIQTQGNSEKGQLAARYLAGVNTLKEEFANLAQGGYAPTESAWALANQQINGDYGVKQLGASLDEVQRLIRYRIQGIPNFQTMGPNAGNRYTGTGQGGAAQGGGGADAGGWGKAEVVK